MLYHPACVLAPCIIACSYYKENIVLYCNEHFETQCFYAQTLFNIWQNPIAFSRSRSNEGHVSTVNLVINLSKYNNVNLVWVSIFENVNLVLSECEH